MYEYQDQPEPFRVTPGFVAFVALCFLPVLLALGIFLGAWAVSSEVYAAEAATEGRHAEQAGFNTASEDEVAGWKRTLVAVCPIH